MRNGALALVTVETTDFSVSGDGLPCRVMDATVYPPGHPLFQHHLCPWPVSMPIRSTAWWVGVNFAPLVLCNEGIGVARVVVDVESDNTYVYRWVGSVRDDVECSVCLGRLGLGYILNAPASSPGMPVRVYVSSSLPLVVRRSWPEASVAWGFTVEFLELS